MRRTKLDDQITGLALKSKTGVGGSDKPVSKGTIATIERLVRTLEDLHEPDVYANLPYLQFIHPTVFLTDAHRSAGNHAKVIKYTMEILRNFGFVIPVREGVLYLDGRRGRRITNCESLGALRTAAGL